MTNFPSTLWTVIEDARRGVPEAVERFVLGYRPCLHSYLVRMGMAADADDLVQEIFIRFLMDGVLERVDPRQGRFRHLVRAVTRHVVGHHLERRRAQKRGAGKVEALGERDVAEKAQDVAFDQEWVAHLLDRALERLRRENPRYHDVLSLAASGASHEEIGRRVDLSWGQVKDALYRAKKKLGEFLRGEIREYSTSEADCEAEIEALGRYLPP